MRLEMHYKIAEKISGEFNELGIRINRGLFHFGNFFPDLIHSYFWRPHEYAFSRAYIQKKMEELKKRPLFLSFQLGVLTHYISDYFCYPHIREYNKGLLWHMKYEICQKAPEELMKISIKLKSFAIEELDKLVHWYERWRPLLKDDEQDFQMAVIVSSCFLQAAYECFSVEDFDRIIAHSELANIEGNYPAKGFSAA